MTEVISFFERNYEWIFSGIGVLIIGSVIARKKLNNRSHKNVMKNNSSGIQCNRDINIHVNEK